MKKIYAIPFVVALGVGLVAPKIVYADSGGTGTGTATTEDSGANYGSSCGTMPTGGPPSSEVTACSKNGYACSPASPEPTTWTKYCCYDNVNNQANYRWYRWQCCVGGGSASWQLAYKKTMDVGSC